LPVIETSCFFWKPGKPEPAKPARHHQFPPENYLPGAANAEGCSLPNAKIMCCMKDLPQIPRIINHDLVSWSGPGGMFRHQMLVSVGTEATLVSGLAVPARGGLTLSSGWREMSAESERNWRWCAMAYLRGSSRSFELSVHMRTASVVVVRMPAYKTPSVSNSSAGRPMHLEI
jgi:hypothetical protein